MDSSAELNQKWDIKKIIEETAKSAHYNPAPETKERLVALEISTKIFMEENSKQHLAIMSSLNEFHITNKEAMKEMSNKLDKALEEKAGVWVEQVIKWVGVIVGAGILGYFGTLIVKVIELK